MKKSKRVVGIVQARTQSTRLPRKVLLPIERKPLLQHVIERISAARTLDQVIIATSNEKADDAIEELARALGTTVVRGSESDVLDRYYIGAMEAHADIVVRITGDCPLHDSQVIDEVVEHFKKTKVDYLLQPRNYPEGLDTEVFTFAALERSWKEAKLPSEREHVTPYILNHPEIFRAQTEWKTGEVDHSSMHWSVDTDPDFRFVSAVYAELYSENPAFGKDDVLALLARKPELLELNRGGTGYEGLAKSLKEDEE